MSRIFVYVVDRDFGFAPNPFHGSCTLATCKAAIRKSADIEDWVVGIGGTRLRATGHCIFGMRVTRKMSFDQYWSAPEFKDKIPIRNGSRCMMLGDNIYHRDSRAGRWVQADSHHSNADGSANMDNLVKDTKADAVLISGHYYYFGRAAPGVPKAIFKSIGYKNGRSHRVFELNSSARKLVDWLEGQFADVLNRVSADPFDFEKCSARYSVKRNKLY